MTKKQTKTLENVLAEAIHIMYDKEDSRGSSDAFNKGMVAGIVRAMSSVGLAYEAMTVINNSK